MRVSRIYTDVPLTENLSAELNPKTSHYISRVLRLKEGTSLILFDGSGRQFDASINHISKNSVTVDVGPADQTSVESPLNIHLGIAISKGDRMDWVIQKATELGVSEITPLLSQRVEVKLKGERLQKKQEHWQQIGISSCEQCGRNLVPQVHPLTDASSWINAVNAEKKFVLHHRSEHALDPTAQVNSIALLIGPEGGLAEQEIITAEQHGFSSLRLGPRVLRTETAPLAAIAILQNIWGDIK